MARIDTSRHSSRKDVIASKAAELFRRKGFAGTSMRELAEGLGVEAASLYNHIGSKVELLQLLCFGVASRFSEHLASLEERGLPPQQQLEELVRFHIRMMLDHPDEVYVSNHDWKQLTEPELGEFLQQRRRYENRLVDILQKGMSEGVFVTRDPLVAAYTILSALRGLEWLQPHRRNISEQVLVRDMTAHLLHGIIQNI